LSSIHAWQRGSPLQTQPIMFRRSGIPKGTRTHVNRKQLARTSTHCPPL
jgi:hypothetical protein